MAYADLVEQIRFITNAEGQKTDVVVPIAVWEELIEPLTAHPASSSNDPLIGLFAGSSDLVERSEEILTQGIKAEALLGSRL